MFAHMPVGVVLLLVLNYALKSKIVVNLVYISKHLLKGKTNSLWGIAKLVDNIFS